MYPESRHAGQRRSLSDRLCRSPRRCPAGRACEPCGVTGRAVGGEAGNELLQTDDAATFGIPAIVAIVSLRQMRLMRPREFMAWAAQIGSLVHPRSLLMRLVKGRPGARNARRPASF